MLLIGGCRIRLKPFYLNFHGFLHLVMIHCHHALKIHSHRQFQSENPAFTLLSGKSDPNAYSGKQSKDLQSSEKSDPEACTGFQSLDLQSSYKFDPQACTGYQSVNPQSSEKSGANAYTEYQRVNPQSSDKSRANAYTEYQSVNPQSSDKSGANAYNEYQRVNPQSSDKSDPHAYTEYQRVNPQSNDKSRANAYTGFQSVNPQSSDKSGTNAYTEYQSVNPQSSEESGAYAYTEYQNVNPQSSDNSGANAHTGHQSVNPQSSEKSGPNAYTGFQSVNLQSREKLDPEAYTGFQNKARAHWSNKKHDCRADGEFESKELLSSDKTDPRGFSGFQSVDLPSNEKSDPKAYGVFQSKDPHSNEKSDPQAYGVFQSKEPHSNEKSDPKAYGVFQSKEPYSNEKSDPQAYGVFQSENLSIEMCVSKPFIRPRYHSEDPAFHQPIQYHSEDAVFFRSNETSCKSLVIKPDNKTLLTYDPMGENAMCKCNETNFISLNQQAICVPVAKRLEAAPLQIAEMPKVSSMNSNPKLAEEKSSDWNTEKKVIESTVSATDKPEVTKKRGEDILKLTLNKAMWKLLRDKIRDDMNEVTYDDEGEILTVKGKNISNFMKSYSQVKCCVKECCVPLDKKQEMILNSPFAKKHLTSRLKAVEWTVDEGHIYIYGLNQCSFDSVKAKIKEMIEKCDETSVPNDLSDNEFTSLKTFCEHMFPVHISCDDRHVTISGKKDTVVKVKELFDERSKGRPQQRGQSSLQFSEMHYNLLMAFHKTELEDLLKSVTYVWKSGQEEKVIEFSGTLRDVFTVEEKLLEIQSGIQTEMVDVLAELGSDKNSLLLQKFSSLSEYDSLYLGQKSFEDENKCVIKNAVKKDSFMATTKSNDQCGRRKDDAPTNSFRSPVGRDRERLNELWLASDEDNRHGGLTFPGPKVEILIVHRNSLAMASLWKSKLESLIPVTPELNRDYL